MTAKENIQKILEELGTKTTLVAAVKYVGLEEIKTAIDSGITDIGFNTYQQMNDIARNIPKTTRTHFIGTLQKNKAKKVVELNPALIQSIDSHALAKKIDDTAKSLGRTQDILIQIKTDPCKNTGIPPSDMEDIITKINTLDNVKIRGLMTVHPHSENPQDSRQYFRQMNSYFQKAGNLLGRDLDHLSMGMSDDYQIAREEGSNMVRIGSRLFR